LLLLWLLPLLLLVFAYMLLCGAGLVLPALPPALQEQSPLLISQHRPLSAVRVSAVVVS
jgi:hypothetical protein